MMRYAPGQIGCAPGRNAGGSNRMERLAYTIKEVLELVGIGKTKLYEISKAGGLPMRKVGAKTIILSGDLRAWLERLPRANPVEDKEGEDDDSD
jgi:excisionase family DNA binding protein